MLESLILHHLFILIHFREHGHGAMESTDGAALAASPDSSLSSALAAYGRRRSGVWCNRLACRSCVQSECEEYIVVVEYEMKGTNVGFGLPW